VKRIYRRENFETPFVMAEFSRELEKSFVCLDTTVAEETFAWADEIDQRLSEPALRFVVVKVRRMDDFARLLRQGLDHGRMRMAE